MEARLRRAGTVDDLLSHASQEVARASQQLSFAIAPGGETATLEHLEFVPLDGGKVLVVVVSTGGHVAHKVISPAEPHDHTELQQAANYLNSEFKGQSLVAVRQAVLQRLREERNLYDELMARALRLASTTFADMTSEPAVFIQGRSLLLEDVGGESPDVTLETLRTLLRMIEEKARLIQLLDDYISGDDLTDRHRIRAPLAGSSALQPDRLPLFGRPRHRRRRRDRPDPDAVLARDQCRRRTFQGDQPDGQRPFLNRRSLFPHRHRWKTIAPTPISI